MKKKKKAALSKSIPFLRSKEWKDLRLLALDRDDNKCILCGSTDNLCVHHILYRKWYSPHKLDLLNCITLCPHCHFIIHKGVGNLLLADFLKSNRPDQWEYVIQKLK